MKESEPASQLKRALVAVKVLRSKLEAIEEARSEPIAIIGMSCRLPGAGGLASYWKLLVEGVDAIKEVPRDRWNIDDYYDPDPEAPGKMYTRWGGFIDGADLFDPQFFGISPREAAAMDPQQRLLLEVAWEALEAAGQAPNKLAGTSTGVFLGIASTDYGTAGIKTGLVSAIDAYAGTGTVNSIAAGRLSYLLGAHGPNFPIDTACSSSLVALHLACSSLRSGESDLALAGGVNILLLPEASVFFSKLHAMSPDGRCKTFDASADGYVRGEGCGIVVLKRLSDAIAARDHIHAVIRGSAVNHDGRSNGLTAPNGNAQEAVIRSALKNAKVDPADVGYIEAHGTGTALGDPIEAQALANVLGQRDLQKPFLLGSVKTNIGHLEAAAGVASLIKAVLALEHGVIPPHLHLKKKSPYINWDEFPVQIPTQVTPWPSWQRRRIAGVSSFGFSGTNAHVVIEQAPEAEGAAGKEDPSEREHVVTLSARSEAALQALVQRYGEALSADASMRLGDAAWTANVGRAQFKERAAVVGNSCAEVGEKLKRGEYKRGRPEPGRRVKVGFLFSGQGSQYVGMGRELYESEEEYRQWIDKAAGVLEEETGRKLLEVMWGRQDGLDETEWTQPALYAVEYALAQQWKQWGVEAAAVMGHSIGEYAAAAVAGVLEWEQGLRLVARRGRMMQRLGRGGAMAAVYASGEEVERRLRNYAGRVTIAAWNGREQVTIAGEEDGVEALSQELRAEGRRVERLRVSEGFHSQRMEPMLEELEREIGKVERKRPERTLVLNLTGEVSDGEEIRSTEYWRRQAREAVRFEQGVKRLAAEVDVIVEVGPAPVLLGLGMEAVEKAGLVWTASLSRKRKDRAQMLEAAAEMYVAGVNLDWDAIDGRQHKVVLPTYPFQRQRYWMEPAGSERSSVVGTDHAVKILHPLLGYRLRTAAGPALFESVLAPAAPEFLGEHRVYENVIAPATAFVELGLAAANHALGFGNYSIRQMAISEALLLDPDSAKTVQVAITDGLDGAAFEIFSLSTTGEAQARQGAAGRGLQTAATAKDASENWHSHAKGVIVRDAVIAANSLELNRIRAACKQELPVDEFYSRLRAHGFDYGPRFRGLQRIWMAPSEALGFVRMPDSFRGEVSGYFAHPALLDACLQLFAATLGSRGVLDTYLPIQFEHIAIHGKLDASFWCHAKTRGNDTTAEILITDLHLYDEHGEPAGLVEGLAFKRASRDAIARQQRKKSEDWHYELQWKLSPIPTSSPVQAAGGSWLILADRSGIGAALARSLKQRGESVNVLERHTDDPEQTIRHALNQYDANLQNVVHLWSLDATDQEDFSACASALAVAQQLAVARTTGAQMCFVTQGGMAAPDWSAPLSPVQSLVWGLARVVAMEHPALRCIRLDLDPRADADTCAQAIIDNLSVKDNENEVALRNHSRYVPRLVRAAVPVNAGGPQGFAVRGDGAYLITGGMGGLGLKLAAWLAERGATNIILVGRNDPSPDARAVIDQLQNSAVNVIVRRADVSRFAELESVFAEFSEEMPLRGIIHAAGVLDDGVLLQQTWARFERVLDPKAKGAWNLHRLTAGRPLDFFVMMSSVASIIGAPGQSNYAAGNAFLDALAHYRRAQALPALTVNWGPWDQSGMAANAAARHRWSAQGVNLISPETGIQILESLLRSGATQRVVMQVNWTRFVHVLELVGSPVMLEELLAEGRTHVQSSTRDADGAFLTQLKHATAHRRRALLVNYLKEQVQKTLGVGGDQQVQTKQSLIEMGLDSLMATELRNRIQMAFGRPIPITVVFDFPTIEALADYIGSNVLHLDGAASVSETPSESSATDAVVEEVRHLSEEEVARSIAAELEAIKNEL